MWRLISAVKGLVVGGQQETQEDKIRRLEAQIADEDEVDGEAERQRLEEQRRQEQNKPTNCFQQTGELRCEISLKITILNTCNPFQAPSPRSRRITS